MTNKTKVKTVTKETMDWVELAGGPAETARHVGVTRQSVHKWYDISESYKKILKPIIIKRISRLNRMHDKYF